jgi:hypothetical protein
MYIAELISVEHKQEWVALYIFYVCDALRIEWRKFSLYKPRDQA